VLKRVNGADEWLTLAGLYERRKTMGSTQHIFTISGLTGPAVQVVWQQGGGDRTLYLHTDQLGSIDTISDSAGGVEHLKYDPYGQRVQPTQLDQPVTASSFGERRGFTGHEHDDDLDLINMQGRIFDPGSGRFLTTDPVVTSPASGQSYNPYSYALNNPVTLTDPSGFQYEMEGGAPFAGDNGLTIYFSTAAPAPAQSVKVVPLGTTASIRDRLQSVGACSGSPAPAGYLCAFGVTLNDRNRYDLYMPIGGNPRGSNVPWGRVTRGLATILPSWARLNPDTKQAIDGALLLASIIPIGEVASLLKQIGTEQANAFFRRVLTGFHGTKGENVLGIIDKGGFIPKEGKVWLGDAPGPTFQYGADPAHGASFSLEVEVPADGLKVERISAPHIPNTTVIHSSELVPATVKRMFVRTPDGEGGFAVQVIEGIDAIRAFFGR
jgi:RHS repeat-associated protein